MKTPRTKTAGQPAAKIAPKPGELWQQLNHTFHTSPTFMDYLHGDVDPLEAHEACRYEYARESPALWELARQRDELRAACPKDWPARIAASLVERHFQENGWTKHPGNALRDTMLLAGKSFPKKDWKELTFEERVGADAFAGHSRIAPLTMPPLFFLQMCGVLGQLSKMGEDYRTLRHPPFLQKQNSESVFYAMFEVDFAKTKRRLMAEFEKWLMLRENRERLEKHKTPTVGTTGKWLDRLKDLAAWRLYREFAKGRSPAKALEAANEFADEHRKHFTQEEIRKKFKTLAERKQFRPGDPRPFHNAKCQKGQVPNDADLPPNKADLFSEDAEARKAKAGALDFLREIRPDQYPPHPTEAEIAEFDNIRQIVGRFVRLK